MDGKRTWLYCRVAHNGAGSTDALAVQQHRLETYAKEHDFEIVGSSKDIASGLTLEHRPGLLDFHHAAVDGEVDILLITDLARLIRDIDRGIQYWHLLSDLAVSVYTENSGELDLSIAAMLQKMLEQ